MSETTNSKIIAFPAGDLHRLDTGGVLPMEIKHSHPPHESADKRRENLREKHRTCLALLAAARGKEAARMGKGA